MLRSSRGVIRPTADTVDALHTAAHRPGCRRAALSWGPTTKMTLLVRRPEVQMPLNCRRLDAEIPLGADFVVGRLLRIHVGIVLVSFRRVELEVRGAGRRCRRRAVRRIDDCRAPSAGRGHRPSPLTSVSLPSQVRHHAGCRNGCAKPCRSRSMRTPPLTRNARTEVEGVEDVQGDCVGAAFRKRRRIGTMFMPTTGTEYVRTIDDQPGRESRRRSASARTDVSRRRVRGRALSSCCRLPVVTRAARFVWFDRMSLCRSLA